MAEWIEVPFVVEALGDPVFLLGFYVAFAKLHWLVVLYIALAMLGAF